MKIFIKKIDDDGNIEISAFKNINAGNDFDSLLYPPEDVCIKSEEINIFDLLEENKKLKKENDILLNVQEDAEKSLHKIRELKKELNKVNDENEKLKEEVINLAKEVGRWNSYYDDEFNENLKLKKQLEEKENIACDWKDSCLENAGKIEILETQQKAFIKFLESELLHARYYARDIAHYIEFVLRRYKEIVKGTERVKK